MSAPASPTPARLTVDHQHAPIGVAVHEPVLAWQVPGAAPATAYEVEVRRRDAATGEPLDPAVWATGRVEVPEPPMRPWLPYAGAPLVSDADYTWRVRVWTSAAGAGARPDGPDPTDGAEGAGVLAQRLGVRAGVGLDAQSMENTSDDLKRGSRSGAYALAAVQNAAPNPFTATVTLDDDEPTEQQAVMALLGNVGTITAGVPLFPQASPSDGKVDLMLANPDRVVDWARLGAQILTGRDQEGFTTTSASRVRIATDRPVPFELDGDTVGTTRSLTVEIEPGALLVVAPRH